MAENFGTQAQTFGKAFNEKKNNVMSFGEILKKYLSFIQWFSHALNFFYFILIRLTIILRILVDWKTFMLFTKNNHNIY